MCANPLPPHLLYSLTPPPSRSRASKQAQLFLYALGQRIRVWQEGTLLWSCDERRRPLSDTRGPAIAILIDSELNIRSKVREVVAHIALAQQLEDGFLGLPPTSFLGL